MDQKFCKYKLIFPHSLRSFAGENKIPRQARDDVSGDVVETFVLYLKLVSFVILSEASAESKDLNFERTKWFSFYFLRSFAGGRLPPLQIIPQTHGTRLVTARQKKSTVP